MPRGGKREGAGRKKRADILRAAVVQMQDQLPKDSLAVVMARCPAGVDSLGLIQHVRDAPETPPDLRLKLAVAAMPFEVPKPDKRAQKAKEAKEIEQESDAEFDARLNELLRKAGIGEASGGRAAAQEAPKDRQLLS